VPRLVDRLARGERVVFDTVKAGGFGKTRLILTSAGIQEREKPPVLWPEVVGISEGQIPGFVTVETSDRQKTITFGDNNALNALVALQVIEAMIKAARAGTPLSEKNIDRELR
jgi:hypothetical protein